MIYNEREQKLIRLALDPGAAPGELQNAAMMVFKSLKARGIMADALFGNQPPPPPPPPKSPKYIFPDWGKYAGMPFDQIERSYFHWLLRVWFPKLDDEGRKSWNWLQTEITEYLK